MKGILKLAVFGIAISAFVSCQKDEPLNDPHIKPATGEFDKGVTISYNSAAGKEDIWEVILANTHYCINPVNWKTDDTPATFKYDGMELTNHIDRILTLSLWTVSISKHIRLRSLASPHAPFLRKNIKDRAYR